eukprot:CAMPEP_0172490230 /NCGR_PEP_ID=MMETSP1066-20121228/20570_1 /TAXON_ID=671091 /ORGANISM="Coscinodiscus wailesii, Strain CCMP2513" /LENGTH=102 /DNA_ID=CAMNT_0013258587 /DNA_START=54 /DNA_END=359 /DNA_ORIENTATION=+
MTSLRYRNLTNATVLSAIETQYSALKRLSHKSSYYLSAGSEIFVIVLLHTPCDYGEHKKRRFFSAPSISSMGWWRRVENAGKGLVERSETSYYEVPSGKDEV